jgi:hypothetical protein
MFVESILYYSWFSIPGFARQLFQNLDTFFADNFSIELISLQCVASAGLEQLVLYLKPKFEL